MHDNQQVASGNEAIAANGKAVDVLDGLAFARVPRNGFVTIGLTTDGESIHGEVYIDSELVYQRGLIPFTNRTPVEDDTVVWRQAVRAGSKIRLNAYNTDAAAHPLFWKIEYEVI